MRARDRWTCRRSAPLPIHVVDVETFQIVDPWGGGTLEAIDRNTPFVRLEANDPGNHRLAVHGRWSVEPAGSAVLLIHPSGGSRAATTELDRRDEAFRLHREHGAIYHDRRTVFCGVAHEHTTQSRASHGAHDDEAETPSRRAQAPGNTSRGSPDNMWTEPPNSFTWGGAPSKYRGLCDGSPSSSAPWHRPPPWGTSGTGDRRRVGSNSRLQACPTCSSPASRLANDVAGGAAPDCSDRHGTGSLESWVRPTPGSESLRARERAHHPHRNGGHFRSKRKTPLSSACARLALRRTRRARRSPPGPRSSWVSTCLITSICGSPTVTSTSVFEPPRSSGADAGACSVAVAQQQGLPDIDARGPPTSTVFPQRGTLRDHVQHCQAGVVGLCKLDSSAEGGEASIRPGDAATRIFLESVHH